MKRTPPPFAALAAALALVAPARATDYWLVKSETDSGTYSSISGLGTNDVHFSGWTTTRGGTEKEPFGEGDFRFGAVDPDGVYHVDGTGLDLGMCVRLMGETGQGSYAFRGGALVFEGGKACLNNKTRNTFTVTNLCVVSGTTAEFRTGDASNTTVTYEGTNWVVEAGAALFFGSGRDGWRTAVLKAPVTGAGTIGGDFGENDGDATSRGRFSIQGDLSGFTGRLVACEKGINTTADATTVSNAYAMQTLAFADARAVPQSTPDGALMRAAVVVTNGATLSFECTATSPEIRGWEFGSGATPSVYVTRHCTATILGPVAGTVGLNKTGDGTLVLNIGGAGEYGTIELAGTTNVSAAALADYAEACEGWIVGTPMLGAASPESVAETSARFGMAVRSLGRGATNATITALVLAAGADDPWDPSRAFVSIRRVQASALGPASFVATGLSADTGYQIRFVITCRVDGETRAVTNAPVAFSTPPASPEPTATLSLGTVGYDDASFEAGVPRFGTGARRLDSLVLRYGTDPTDESGWSSAAIPPPAAEHGLVPCAATGLRYGTTYYARLDATNDLGRVFTTDPAIVFTTLTPGPPAGTATLSGTGGTRALALATATSLGTGGRSVQMRLEASTDPDFGTLAAASDWGSGLVGGKVALAADGLSPGTAYHLRVRFMNNWGLESVVELGSATTGRILYVDAASAAADPDGSAAAPFPTIKAAIDAANALAGECATILVAPGTYSIASAEDLSVVTASNLLVRASDPANRPVVSLSANLSAVQANPIVFDVASSAARFEMRGFVFEYSYAADGNAAGNSLGDGGKIFRFNAVDCAVDGCRFVQTGTTGRYWGEGGLVGCNDRGRAARVVVRNCRFDGVGASTYRPIKIGDDARIVGNVFVSCSGFFTMLQYSTGGAFVSNRVVNCTNPIYSNGDNYRELRNAEVAYNVFVNSGVGAFQKRNNVGFAEQPRFHHNTVVGCGYFIQVPEVNSIEWTPWIFDNLVIAPETGCVIREDATSLANRKSSFKEGSFFTGNVWRAPDLLGGTAPARFDDYAVGLALEGNKRLVDVPEFLETEDPESPDFYRLNAARHPWVRTVARGASGTVEGNALSYPATYVGAVEPADVPPAEPGGFFLLESFDVELSSALAPASATLTVSWSGNAGAVAVSWDFDGDGTWDRTGMTSGTVNWSYPDGGVFRPRVRLVDDATSKTIVAECPSVVKLRVVDAYVDANASPGGNGTISRPFRSIAEAAAICDRHATVHVRGGPDRIYSIMTADDLVTIPERFVTIESWGNEGRARIFVASTLHAATNNASVFTVPVDSVDATFRGLEFTYYGARPAEESSLGFRGRCIDTSADRTTVEDCVFRQVGDYTETWGPPCYDRAADGPGHAAIGARSKESDHSKGRYMTVRRCQFLGESNDRSMSAIRQGTYSVIAENVFSNCWSVHWPVKGDWTPALLESNILFRCGSIPSNSGNYNEWRDAEVRFNVVWCEPGQGVPFLTKTFYGLNDSCRIHHNTFVNVSHLVLVANSSSISWHPRFFDNLIVVDPEGEDGRTVFRNNQTAFASGNSSSFKTGGDGCLMNNAWHAPDGISGGPATEVAGYDLSAGCLVTNNIALGAPPAFVSTKIWSPNFCRPAVRNDDWIRPGHAWTNDGEYPDWIGAKPGWLPEFYRTLLILR
jgi:hypothetical protein